MDKPALGQRVVVTGSCDGQDFTHEAGIIASNPGWIGDSCVTVRFDRYREALHDGNKGDNGHHWFFDMTERGFSITPEHRSTYLNGETTLADIINGALAAREKASAQPRFVTAWKDGPDFELTGDNAFNTQRDADNHANELVAGEPDTTVVVLKVVSMHSSRIVVTTEAA